MTNDSWELLALFVFLHNSAALRSCLHAADKCPLTVHGSSFFTEKHPLFDSLPESQLDNIDMI